MQKDTVKEVGISALRSMFSAIPYAGQVLNEVFFEFRGRVKQERLNKFTELLSGYFAENVDLEISNIKTEEFGDLLEATLNKVARTRSQLKLERFRDVLVGGLFGTRHALESAELFLDLVDGMSDGELRTLVYNARFCPWRAAAKGPSLIEMQRQVEALQREIDGRGIDNSTGLGQSEIAQKKGELARIEGEMESVKLILFANQIENASDYLKIERGELTFYRQTLTAKGLLLEHPQKRGGGLPFDCTILSEFGVRFVAFVIGEDKDSIDKILNRQPPNAR